MLPSFSTSLCDSVLCLIHVFKNEGYLNSNTLWIHLIVTLNLKKAFSFGLCILLLPRLGISFLFLSDETHYLLWLCNSNSDISCVIFIFSGTKRQSLCKSCNPSGQSRSISKKQPIEPSSEQFPNLNIYE